MFCGKIIQISVVAVYDPMKRGLKEVLEEVRNEIFVSSEAGSRSEIGEQTPNQPGSTTVAGGVRAEGEDTVLRDTVRESVDPSGGFPGQVHIRVGRIGRTRTGESRRDARDSMV